MRIIVTGAAGFIGSHITDELIKKGHEVAVIDDLSSGKRVNVNPEAKFFHLDIREKDRLEHIFKEFKPEIINHHAAQIDVRKSIKDPDFDESVNYYGSMNLLNLSQKYSVEKFIFASSGGAVYGNPEYLPVDEKHHIEPLSPYGQNKFRFEQELQSASNNGLKITNLRYANVYGPRQDPYGEAGVIAIFTYLLSEGKRPLIFGDGENTRDYVFVEDVVQANIKALNFKGRENTFNIGTGIQTSVNELSKKLIKITKSDVTPIHGDKQEGEVSNICLDFSLATKKLNWRPKKQLDQGLKETVKHIFSH